MERKKGKGIGKVVMLSILIVVLVLGVSALGWWVRESLSASKIPSAEAEAASGEGEAGSAEKTTEPDENPAIPEKSKPSPVQGLLALEPFTVNLADGETPRYMRMAVKLGMDSADVVEEIKKDEITGTRVRDGVLALATSLTSDQVLTAEGKAKLRKDIGDRINGILQKGKVLEVYIIELVVQ